MAGDTVSEVKSRLSIVDVASPYVKLLRAGANYKARCPFHGEKTPSFMVSPERGTYHCFGCGVGGDMFTFVQEIEGVDFKGALKILAEKAGVPLVYSRGQKKDPTDRLYEALEAATQFFEKALTEKHPAYSYLEKRGLTRETIRSFRLGFAADEWRMLTEHLRSTKYTDAEIEAAGLAKRKEGGRGDLYDRFRSRITFPLFDSAGRVVGFSGRIFGDNQPADTAKYLNSPETALYHKSKLLYGFDRAKHHIRKLNFSILVEGQMDLLMVHQAGWPNAVAVSGTALTKEHLASLMRMSENVVLALDADKAGIEAARRSATLALSMGMDVKVARIPSGKDPADFILAEGKEGWKKAIREAKHVVEFLLEALKENSKDARAYAKLVRAQVLPFVALIKSPIDRDHFVSLVAAQLAVSEDAVREELGSVKPIEEASRPITPPPTPQKVATALSPRLRQAYGVMLWQEALPKSAFGKSELEALLEDSIGADATKLFESIPEDARTKLGFEAERHFTYVRDIKHEIKNLFRHLKADRLRAELKSAQTPVEQAKKAKELQELLEL